MLRIGRGIEFPIGMSNIKPSWQYYLSYMTVDSWGPYLSDNTEQIEVEQEHNYGRGADYWTDCTIQQSAAVSRLAGV
jgi:hypothetical protein